MMEKNPPKDVLRDGNLKASIWRNEGENGAFLSTTFARTFKTENGEYKDTNSFNASELLRLSELARTAYARNRELRQQMNPKRAAEQDVTHEETGREEPAPNGGEPQESDDPEQRREAFNEKRNGGGERATERNHKR